MRRIGPAVFLALGLAFSPLTGDAQQAPGKAPLIGLLDFGAPDAARVNWWTAFRNALRELGYLEGQNVAFEARWAEGRVERLPALAAELVGRRVDILVTGGGETARVAKQATATIPIVMADGADRVRLGVVQSLGRPGGNVTGVTSISSELVAKRVELLREFRPKISRLAVLWDGTPNSRISLEALEDATRPQGITIRPFRINGPGEWDQAFSIIAKEGPLFVIASPALFIERKRIADLALKHRLLTVVGGREYAEAGGFFPYAVHYPDLFRRAASYVDKILKGAKPAELPIEQPVKYELVINLKTAKALGLTIPQSLLARADEIIQ